MNTTEQAELILKEAESKLAVLANEYARSVIHPFCDKYGLEFRPDVPSCHSSGGFYFYNAKKTGKYSRRIDGLVKSCMDDDRLTDNFLDFNCSHSESKQKCKESLQTLTDEFWEEFFKIQKTIISYIGYNHERGETFFTIKTRLSLYIPRYPTVQ